MRIADINPELRPREKACSQGLGSLSDVELLALLIGSGVKGHNALEISASLLYSHGGVGGLSRLGFASLVGECGVSKATALRLAACFELNRRLACAASINPLGGEEVWLFAFSKSKKPAGRALLYKGGAARVGIDIREVARSACAIGASSVLLVHTHPSGAALPSPEDIRLTSSLRLLLQELGIKLLDHIIKAAGQSYSMKANGLLT